MPLIKHAQALASRAAPKDYLGQVREIYNDFVNRWRYVHDPVELELMHVSGPSVFGEVLGFAKKHPKEHGKGDCDDAVIGISSLLLGIGIPIEIHTSAPPENSPLYDPRIPLRHVYAKAKVPGVGWITVDPVGHPHHPLGWTPPYSRLARWDLKGNLLGLEGKFPKGFNAYFGDTENEIEEAEKMQPIEIDTTDYGLGAFAGEGLPLDWSQYGLLGFGAYAGQLGIIDGTKAGLLMGFDEEDILDIPGYEGLVRNKMLEVSPVDFELVRRFGAPRMGSVALGDDGSVYQWQKLPDTNLGFFKKIFQKVGGAIKKGVQWVGGKAKQLISKLPGGQYLIRLYDKAHKISMRLVRPLSKLLGSKLGQKISHLASLIPGYGPVVSAALAKAGEFTKLLDDMKIETDPKGKPKFESGEQAKEFQKKLKRKAEKAKKKLKEKKEKKKKEKVKKAKEKWKAKKVAELEAKYEERLQKELAKQAQASPGVLLKAGTPEHAQALRDLGFDVDSWMYRRPRPPRPYGAFRPIRPRRRPGWFAEN